MNLQQVGGGRARWKPNVDFYADVLHDSQAYVRLNAAGPAGAEPFWLGLHPFVVIDRLFVSSGKVIRSVPLHRFERHPGVRQLPNSTLLGFRLRLTGGTYFEIERR